LPSDIQGNAGPAVSAKAYQDTQQPYFKPRSIFDRQQASLLNAEKAYEELQAQQEMQNKLKLLESEGPILANNQGLMYRQGEQNSANLDNQALLHQTGQLVNPANLQAYSERNTKPLQEGTANSIIAKAIQALTGRKQSELQGDIFDTTKQSQIDEAVAKQATESALAEGRFKQVPQLLRDQLAGLDVAPRLKAAEAVRAENMIVPEGSTAYNLGSNRPLFTAPNRMQKAMDQLNSLQGGNIKTPGLFNNTTNQGIVPAGTSPMNQPVGDSIQHPDQDTVIINGTVYKRNPNPAAKF
jgi:hypothetical protein